MLGLSGNYGLALGVYRQFNQRNDLIILTDSLLAAPVVRCDQVAWSFLRPVDGRLE